jgi:hypothetical protein
MRYIVAMPNAPVFSLPRLDRLGDRLAADVAAGAISGAEAIEAGRMATSGGALSASATVPRASPSSPTRSGASIR